MSDLPTPIRAAIYARVSTEDQSCDLQVERLTHYCLSRGWSNPEVFRDDGISGVRDNRPQLDRLRAKMAEGEVSTVVVTKMDRLGRSLGMILRFWDEAVTAGSAIVVVDQSIDTSTPSGRLQRNMLAALAEFERDTIYERTKAGIDRARRAGKKFGRPRTIPEDVRALIVERSLAGQKPREISIALKVKASTVRSILVSAKSPPLVSAGSSPPVDPPPA